MFDLLMYLKVFLVGGFVCLLGQILIITTKITSARILVTFLTLGAVLHLIGIFEPIKEFCGSGITLPITGFGYLLAKGAAEGASSGVLGMLGGGLTSVAAGISVAVLSAFIFALIFQSKTKKA